MMRLTGDGEVPEEFVRVGGAQELDETELGVLAADDWGDLEVLELIEDAAQLEWFLVVFAALGEGILLVLVVVQVFDLVGLFGLRSSFLLDGKDLFLDLVCSLLHLFDRGGGHGW